MKSSRSVFPVVSVCCLILFAGMAWSAVQEDDHGAVVHFQRLDMSEGLIHQTVYCVAQDKWGFIWFGTEGGLEWYDGIAFKTFTRSEMQPNGLTDSRIRVLHADQQSGDLWIGTISGGLNIYHPETNTFESFRNDPENPESLSSNQVTCIADIDGSKWIGTVDGLNRLAAGEKSFRIFRPDPTRAGSISNGRIRCLLADGSGGLWVGTDDGLNHFDGREFTRIAVPRAAAEAGSAERITSLLRDSRRTIWIGTSRHGLFRADSRGENLQAEELRIASRTVSGLPSISSLSEDTTGTIWLGTFGAGLIALDPANGSQRQFLNNPDREFSVANNRVWQTYVDRSGCLWITTYTGISRLNPEWRFIKLFQHAPDDEASLHNNRTWCFFEPDPGTVWIGTENGIAVFDRSRARFHRLVVRGNSFTPTVQPLVRAITRDGMGNFWVATDRTGLLRLNARGDLLEKFTSQRGVPGSLPNNGIYCLLRDRKNRLWIGTFGGGLARLDSGSHSFVTYRNRPDDRHSLSHNTVWSLLEDRDGEIWIGTYDGLNRYRPETDSFDRYYPTATSQTGAVNNSVFGISQDSSGGLWIGTDGNGFFYFDIKRASFQSYRNERNFSASSVYAVLEDERNNLWISTSLGIYFCRRFSDTKRGNSAPAFTFTSFDFSDGLQDDDFNLGAALKSGNGELLFGGSKGFNLLAPDGTIAIHEVVPPLVISSLQINQIPVSPGTIIDGRVVLTEPAFATDSITLQANENFLTFRFACLDYANPQRNVITYCMEGIMEHWKTMDGDPNADFILAPGDYTLRVRGANKRGIWNEAGQSLKITILPPLQDTWWFRSLLVFFALCLIVAGFKLRTRFYRKRTRMLEQVNQKLVEENIAREKAETELRRMQPLLEAKVQESGKLAEDLEAFDYSVSNALRVPLRLSSGFTDLLQSSLSKQLNDDSRHYLSTIRDSLDEAQRLIDSLLILSRVSREEIKRESVDLTLLARASYDRAVRLAPNSTARLYTESDVIGTGDFRLLQILMNILMENAVIFSSGNTSAEIRFGTKTVNGEPCYFVQDNGEGVSPERLEKIFQPFHSYHTDSRFGGQGLGLATAQRIVNRHGGSIRAESAVGAGATILFTLGA